VTAPWITLLAIAVIYLAMIPFSMASYSRAKRRAATLA